MTLVSTARAGGVPFYAGVNGTNGVEELAARPKGRVDLTKGAGNIAHFAFEVVELNESNGQADHVGPRGRARCQLLGDLPALIRERARMTLDD